MPDRCCVIVIYYAMIVSNNRNYKSAANNVFQAFSLNMFGAKYQWILAGKYADDWWRGEQEAVTTAAEAGDEEEKEGSGDDKEQRCSDEALRVALNGYICADILILSLLQQRTVADLVGCAALRRLSSMLNPLLCPLIVCTISFGKSHENSQKLNCHCRRQIC